ncbi:uncharacterized protein LOC132721483 [Ruditapes philippinarum]|uniref:uncharacterized protein LOC132721483 n=1 Tax=Ruditapes philippinarum TaxID=129788 RepID=UPI00295BEA08|nr:uncharacterized protein LOC132721483 [Ruditapes philippinarum]
MLLARFEIVQDVNVQPPSASAHASASASSSVGIGRGLGGLAGINLNDLLGNGIFAGHVGVQPQIAVRRAPTIARPRRTFILGQGLPRGHFAQQAPVSVPGLPAGLPAGSSTMMFDTPDPQTPDTPDLVYAPRSIMGDMNQIEALRNRHEADGVVFI